MIRFLFTRPFVGFSVGLFFFFTLNSQYIGVFFASCRNLIISVEAL